MREMTMAIMRIAAFHLICWLPFCLIQLIPTQLYEAGPTIRKHSAQSSIDNLFFGGGEKTSITTTLLSASTLATTARRSPQTNNLSTGEFGWRDGRAHTFCAPIRAIPSTNNLITNKIPPKLPTTSHLRFAQQLIAATVHGVEEREKTTIPTNIIKQGRRESAAEKTTNFGFDTLKWRTTFSLRIFGSIGDKENSLSIIETIHINKLLFNKMDKLLLFLFGVFVGVIVTLLLFKICPAIYLFVIKKKSTWN
ncbi:unnamed protein product [Meloidogyne enterolobii]|uniref:Uncharacterized protein n=1 Tax=Meloidogyne enterolobii TaxID=390850 RepID=A0ACB0YN28_MELEN